MKWSNFHVTVNFNKQGDALLTDMRNAVDALPTAPYLWMWLQHFTGSRQEDFTSEDSNDIDRVRIRAAFENKGAKNKGLHVHMLIEIAHTTMVQVSKTGIARAMRELVNANPNVHCRFVPGTGEDKNYLLHYITKEVPTGKPAKWQNAQLQNAFNGEVVAADNHPL